jgi:ABC-type transport system involved in cytochrome c biogenesis permease subunit
MTPFDTFYITLILVIAIPVIVFVCLDKPKIVPLCFIAVLFTFSDSTWGQLKIESTIYGRGTGLLNFSLLEIVLLSAGFACLVRKLANPYNTRLSAPLTNYFAALVVLLTAHVLVGTYLQKDIFTILSNNGIINILNMLIFMYMVIMAFNREKDDKTILTTVIVLAGIRAAFGLIRYFLFDGDSANP